MCEDIVDSNIDDLFPEKGGRLSNCFELVDYGGRFNGIDGEIRYRRCWWSCSSNGLYLAKVLFSSLNFTQSLVFFPKTLKKKNCFYMSKISHKINIMNAKIQPNSCLNLLPCCWDTHFSCPIFISNCKQISSRIFFFHIHQTWTWVFMYCQFTKVEIFLEKGNW